MKALLTLLVLVFLMFTPGRASGCNTSAYIHSLYERLEQVNPGDSVAVARTDSLLVVIIEGAFKVADGNTPDAACYLDLAIETVRAKLTFNLAVAEYRNAEMKAFRDSLDRLDRLEEERKAGAREAETLRLLRELVQKGITVTITK